MRKLESASAPNGYASYLRDVIEERGALNRADYRTDEMTPFFIVGFQRSGTTLLRAMLDSHPEVAVPLDTVGLWARYEERLGQYGDLASEAQARVLIEDLLREERIRLWGTPLEADRILECRERPGYAGIIEAFYVAYAEQRGKSAWGDKDPGNMRRLDRILRWFPDARIVHIIRDGRDACLSHLQQSFGHDELFPCADDWREEVWWVRCIGRILGPEQYHELRYEDLVEATEAELRKLCEFLELPYAEQLRSYHERTDEIVPEEKRALWPLLSEPPRRDNLYRWREEMPDGRRVGFEKRAGELLGELGYETLAGHPSGAYLTEMGALVGAALRALRHRLG